tara:strand:+ start:637 stop:945 length:309 start_codon:yes stop_codon:yes gene_type:complete
MQRITYTNTRSTTVKLKLSTGYALLSGDSQIILGELVEAPSYVVIGEGLPPHVLGVDENSVSVMEAPAVEAPAVEAPVVEAPVVTPKKKSTKKAPKKTVSEE